MSRKAFTLLETIIVIAVMTLFFAISIPLFSKFTEKAKLDTTARSITSVLRTARSYAISNNTEYYVFFDATTTPDTYFISHQEDGSVVEEKIYKLPTGVWFYDPDADEVGIGFTEGTLHPDYPNVKAARFKSTGELDETAPNTSVHVADGQTASANKKEITVERTTGRVRIED